MLENATRNSFTLRLAQIGILVDDRFVELSPCLQSERFHTASLTDVGSVHSTLGTTHGTTLPISVRLLSTHHFLGEHGETLTVRRNPLAQLDIEEAGRIRE
jgi:hypothetical protein